MSKKQLNTSTVYSELTDQSAFFKKETKPQSEDKSTEKFEPSGVRDEREERNVRSVRDVRHPNKRERKRHPFDIYRDQLEQLQQMKIEHMMAAGELKSMSEMVREALDDYINTHHNSTERT